jgi:hypothetical protein
MSNFFVLLVSSRITFGLFASMPCAMSLTGRNVVQEISTAANISQKEIARHIKVLSDALKLSQPINSNSISVHMPRFCNLLQLSKTTQVHICAYGCLIVMTRFSRYELVH